MKHELALVVLNWNGIQLLKEFLPSVVEHSANHAAIYLVDNASTDDSVNYVQTHFPQVHVIQNPSNMGYAGGYNHALKQIDAKVYGLLNSDLAVSENWLTPILPLFETNPKLAALQPKVLDYKTPTQFEYAGAAGGFLDHFGYAYCRGRIFWDLEKDTHQYNDTIEVHWASGACFFVRAQDFHAMGGFDESFFAHMEEIDLCWRMRNTGKKIMYCGQSTVYHLGGGTLQNSHPKKTYLNFRNSLLMLVKNLPSQCLFFVIFARMVLDGVTALVFWRYEGFSHLMAILRAHFSFYKNLPQYLKKRSKNPDSNYFEHKFVPFQYFILKRKTIDQLK